VPKYGAVVAVDGPPQPGDKRGTQSVRAFRTRLAFEDECELMKGGTRTRCQRSSCGRAFLVGLRDRVSSKV
jgi:hypothetical protein